MFDSGWAAAVAAIVTALIVAGTAVAAFRQLRHNRNANDIVVYLRLVDFMDAPDTLHARRAMVQIAEKVATDADYREQLTLPGVFPEEFLQVGRMLAFLEHISVLVTKGGVAESLVMAEYADTFVAIWDVLRPAILLRRVAFGNYTSRAFEHLAMRAKLYIDSGAMHRDYAALLSDPRDPQS